MYLRARGQVLGPVNAPVEVASSNSEEDNEEEDINPWKRIKNEPTKDDWYVYNLHDLGIHSSPLCHCFIHISSH